MRELLLSKKYAVKKRCEWRACLDACVPLFICIPAISRYGMKEVQSMSGFSQSTRMH